MDVWDRAWRGRSLLFIAAAYASTHWLGAALLLATIGGVLLCWDALAEIDREHREWLRIEEAARMFVERGKRARAEAAKLGSGPAVEVREYEETGS